MPPYLQEEADKWHALQKEEGYTFDIAYVDITNFESCAAMVAKIESDIGPIDILVNNAGIAHIGNLENTSENDLNKIFQVNVKGIYNDKKMPAFGCKLLIQDAMFKYPSLPFATKYWWAAITAVPS